MEIWLSNFNVQLHPPSGPGSELPMGISMTLGRQEDDPWNPGTMRRQEMPVMSVAQAEEAGMLLADALADINATALAEAVKLRIELAETQVALTRARSELAEASSNASEWSKAAARLGERIERVRTAIGADVFDAIANTVPTE